MLPIPSQLLEQFNKYLQSQKIPNNLQCAYKKWLRYYLDFCNKYKQPSGQIDSLPDFIKKLHEKKQGKQQQEEAAAAINIYYKILRAPASSNKISIHQPQSSSIYIIPQQDNALSVHEHVSTPVQNVSIKPIFQDDKKAVEKTIATHMVQEIGASWKTEYSKLEDEIRVRHYSIKTLRTYKGWLQKFQTFTRSKNPELLSSEDVKLFLTSLAVKRKVSSTTQNQAFNSLLFFYRHILKMEFGKLDGVVRAKRKPYIPVVLSREEIDSILKFLEPPYDLVVKLLYGCGLRLFECLNLRIGCFNFDTSILTIHDGKGQKDRTVPIPETIVPELKVHLQSVVILHQEDLKAGYTGTFLPSLLEKKYKNAAKELVWQWFFPAKTLTIVPETKEKKRYHLHESHVQKAIKRAVSQARIPKRASAHTFRHSFASHLLQANYDIRTIQELLGHSDIRTTMIYTHTIKSQTLKEARSPLDF